MMVIVQMAIASVAFKTNQKQYCDKLYQLRQDSHIAIAPFKITMAMCVLFALYLCLHIPESAVADIIVDSHLDGHVKLIGFNGLDSFTLSDKTIYKRTYSTINTQYTGLILLKLSTGQTYPIISSKKPITIKILAPELPPEFIDSDENEYFYSLLSGSTSQTKSFRFPNLMITAKQLLESSYSIKTPQQLTEKKQEFQQFVIANYSLLKQSDMVRRLIAQSFMMHEYVDYHIEGQPATTIKTHYHNEILNCVRGWITALKETILSHEILNYCVSLYYDRSMISLAARIIHAYKDIAYCPGRDLKSIELPNELPLTTGNRNRQLKFGDIKGRKLIAFVSNECPASMVETVNTARQLHQKSDTQVIVVPLQHLSDKHLSMSQLLSSGTLYFVDDDTWRKTSIPEDLQLPTFLQLNNF